MDKVSYDFEETEIIKIALMDYLVNLKINNGKTSRIQKLQQIIDKMPEREIDRVYNGK
jgi:hypothetical protein|tara:strand:- start:212 stop:385 length:174 start_codon:yes stop_codon:yes gene_type:complete